MFSVNKQQVFKLKTAAADQIDMTRLVGLQEVESKLFPAAALMPLLFVFVLQGPESSTHCVGLTDDPFLYWGSSHSSLWSLF